MAKHLFRITLLGLFSTLIAQLSASSLVADCLGTFHYFAIVALGTNVGAFQETARTDGPSCQVQILVAGSFRPLLAGL